MPPILRHLKNLCGNDSIVVGRAVLEEPRVLSENQVGVYNPCSADLDEQRAHKIPYVFSHEKEKTSLSSGAPRFPAQG